MKLLVLYQARNSAQDQPGYYSGFERMRSDKQLESHVPIGYVGVAESRGWDALWADACRAALEHEADAVFLQFFDSKMPDPTEGISRIKNLPSRPLIFSSLGDPYGRWTKRVPHSFRVASRLSDVSFLTAMGYIARQLSAWGSRNLVLMPNGCCHVRFSAQAEAAPPQPEFNVAFVGSRIRSLNPTSHFYWVARRRVEFVEAFAKRYGKRFGLFGRGWEGNPSWQGPVPYAAQHEAYRRSAVVLGGMPNAYCDYYTSDRVFIAAASGVPLVDYWVSGVDCLLEPGREWWLARDLREMISLCDVLLEMPSTMRVKMGNETRTRILNHHTQYNRCVEMIEIVKSLRESRLRCGSMARPALKFLRASCERRTAPDPIVDWCG